MERAGVRGRAASLSLATLSVGRVPLTPTLSPRALGDSHISEAPSGNHSMEFFETMFEGDRARRLGGRIAVPAAQPGDDPGGPFEAFRAMGIFLKCRGAFEFTVELVENGNFMRGERKSGGLGMRRIPRLDKVHGGCSGFCGDSREADGPFGGFALGGLHP